MPLPKAPFSQMIKLSLSVGGQGIPMMPHACDPVRREVTAMEDWRPVEELIGWGFAHAPVVMANEAHSGPARTHELPEYFGGVDRVRLTTAGGSVR